MPAYRQPFVIVPLYIYPSPTSWEPLFGALSSYPQLDFLVVVNPASGPGSAALPDANYLDALARLSSQPNARILGYVHCSYGHRAAADVERDIRAYQGWNVESRRGDVTKPITVHGIFIDEVPSNLIFVQHMANLAAVVRQSIRPPKDAQESESDGVPGGAESGDGHKTADHSRSEATVVYNPGVVIDPAFFQDADYVVVFENVADQWDSSTVQTGISTLPAPLRKKSIAIAHSSATPEDGLHLGLEAAEKAGFAGQFVTTEAGYTAWCPTWSRYVEQVSGWAPAEALFGGDERPGEIHGDDNIPPAVAAS